MIFVTSSLIGFAAGGFRSAVAYTAIAFLIVASFGAAVLFSATLPSLLGLLLSILGYNFGIMAAIGVMVVFETRARLKAV